MALRAGSIGFATLLTMTYGMINLHLFRRERPISLHSLVRPIQWTEEVAILWPKELLKFVSLGNYAAVGDFVWLKVLMDTHRVRSTRRAANIRTDLELVLGWDDREERRFTTGAYLLTVLRDDHDGADGLLASAMSRFRQLESFRSKEWIDRHWPSYWQVPFLRGFIYLFETPDLERAAYFIDLAAKAQGAPAHLAALAESLKDPLKKYEVQIRVLHMILKSQGETPKVRQLLEKAEIERSRLSGTLKRKQKT